MADLEWKEEEEQKTQEEEEWRAWEAEEQRVWEQVEQWVWEERSPDCGWQASRRSGG